MPLRDPALIHPVRFALVKRLLDESNVKHPQAQEPTRRPRYTPEDAAYILTGQIQIGRHKGYRQRPQGDDPASSGHMLVLASDLARWRAGLYPDLQFNKGDRIIRLYIDEPGEQACDWHVLEVTPAMHYRGAPTGFHLVYQDIKSQAGLSS